MESESEKGLALTHCELRAIGNYTLINTYFPKNLTLNYLINELHILICSLVNF